MCGRLLLKTALDSRTSLQRRKPYRYEKIHMHTNKLCWTVVWTLCHWCWYGHFGTSLMVLKCLGSELSGFWSVCTPTGCTV